MPHWRPLATASTATLTAAVLALSLSGGHSPFAVPSPATQPVANDVAGETASPEAVVASDDPTGSPAPDATAAADPTAKATSRPKSTGSTRSTGSTGSASSGASRGSGSTSDPTAAPTAKPTPRPTPKPTPMATPTPAPTASPTAPPVAKTGTLHVSDNDAGPRLSWTQCSASNFAAYAVVRSLDSEIHYPAEDKDTVVAIIPTISTTALTDTGAPNSKVYYAVWCLSRSDGEYKTIWKTPVVGYAP